MTSSSCSNHMEEKATESYNFVKHLAEKVVQAQTTDTPVLKTSEEMKINTLPPKPSSSQLTDSTPSLSQHPGQSKVANPKCQPDVEECSGQLIL